MKRIFLSTIVAFAVITASNAQNAASVIGKVIDNTGKPLSSVIVSLLKVSDSALIKAAVTNNEGQFEIYRSVPGNYLLAYTSLGYAKIYFGPIKLEAGVALSVDQITMHPNVKKLQDVTVTSSKPLIEIKADKMIFNVENNITATGGNALEILQKSPGVQVDNNDNISMKGKSGAKIYIDGKPTQLDGTHLAGYLKSINSNDVEAIEMISNPGAKYDASGNAGIINIRLKKNKTFGSNGTATAGLVQGITPKGNAALNMNYRNKSINLFGNAGISKGINENGLNLYRLQKDTLYDQTSITRKNENAYNLKGGADFFINRNSTFGVLVTANYTDNESQSTSSTGISYNPTKTFFKTLNAFNTIPETRTNVNSNINYRYADTSGIEVNFDADYGLFRAKGKSYQPNFYIDGNGAPLYQVINRNNAPIDIDIYSSKVDVELPIWKGKLGFGAKFSYVKTANTFEFFNDLNGTVIKILSRSNDFTYKENVNAAYFNYQGHLGTKWNFQLGLRSEQTNSKGVLNRADGIVQADNTVIRNYVDLFPSAALTWDISAGQNLNLAYSRRIDRPSYQDLNPFENKHDELTYQKGNAFLRPQYTDNIELRYTFMSMVNASIGYTHVKDYATATTDTTGNATFLQVKNLATQQILNFNLGTPIPIAKWWSGYANFWYNYQIFEGKIGDNEFKRQVPLYGVFMQNTFTLGNDYSAQISGWLNGPRIWGGTWRVKSQGGVDIGVKKEIFRKTATIKLVVTDIFRTNPWTATNEFGGLNINGSGNWESRTARLSFTYRFGNNQVQAGRKRQTSLENEANRIK